MIVDAINRTEATITLNIHELIDLYHAVEIAQKVNPKGPWAGGDVFSDIMFITMLCRSGRINDEDILKLRSKPYINRKEWWYMTFNKRLFLSLCKKYDVEISKTASTPMIKDEFGTRPIIERRKLIKRKHNIKRKA